MTGATTKIISRNQTLNSQHAELIALPLRYTLTCQLNCQNLIDIQRIQPWT